MAETLHQGFSLSLSISQNASIPAVIDPLCKRASHRLHVVEVFLLAMHVDILTLSPCIRHPNHAQRKLLVQNPNDCMGWNVECPDLHTRMIGFIVISLACWPARVGRSRGTLGTVGNPLLEVLRRGLSRFKEHQLVLFLDGLSVVWQQEGPCRCSSCTPAAIAAAAGKNPDCEGSA